MWLYILVLICFPYANGNTLTCLDGLILSDRSANSVNLQNCTITNARIFVQQNFAQLESYVAFCTFTNIGKSGLIFSSLFSGTSITIENNIFNMDPNYSAIELNGVFYNTPINITNNVMRNLSQAVMVSSSNITGSKLMVTGNKIYNSAKLLHVTNTSITSAQVNVSHNVFNSSSPNGAFFDYARIGSDYMSNSQIYVVRNTINSTFQNYSIAKINASISNTSVFIMYNTMNIIFNVLSNNIINSQNSTVVTFCNDLKNIVNSNCTRYANSTRDTNSYSLSLVYTNTKSVTVANTKSITNTESTTVY